MKGTFTLNLVIELLIFLIIAERSTVEALSPEEVCPLVKNRSFIADPKDCQGWVYCVNGRTIHGKCRGNLRYSSAKGRCNLPRFVECNLNVETMCNGLDDVYKADPTDCNKYCYCLRGETKCANCPLGQVFDPESISCVWNPDATCSVASPCALAPNGFVGDGKTCTGYLLCEDSRVKSSGHCENGLYFNPKIGMCDQPFNVICSHKTSYLPPIATTNLPPPITEVTTEILSEVTTTTLSPIFNVSSVNEEEVTSTTSLPSKNDESSQSPCKIENYLYSDGVSCNGYIHCKTRNEQNPEQKWCPLNQHFNETIQECVDMEKFVCTKGSRCDGSSRRYVAIKHTYCRQYNICRNGIGIGKHQCPRDYPYLHEKVGLCVRNPVDFEICM